jgi:hypothetical protein
MRIPAILSDMSITRAAIALFILSVTFGPLYTAEGYSAKANLISELAGQSTPRNYIMSVAFVLLGASIAFEGLRVFRPALLPFICFGVCFGAAGVFGHKPFTDGVPYIEWVDALHSHLATLSGVALTLGFVWQAIRGPSPRHRILACALAAVCVVFPLLMFNLPAYQGAIQRIMYLALFAWLWACFPPPALPRSC